MSEQDGVKTGTTMKLDAAFLAENEEALIAAGYQRRRGTWSNSITGRKWDEIDEKWKHDEDKEAIIQSKHRKQNEENDTVIQSDQIHCRRKMNPCGSDGRPLSCHSCGSYRHLIARCPYSWENQLPVNAQMTEEVNILRTQSQSQKTNLIQLGIDARNSAVLDSACSSTVCGRRWMEEYKHSLNAEDEKKIIEMESGKTFKFGGGEKLRSLGSYIIPIELAGKKLSLKTDVVDSEIPLVMSKSSMKKANMKINTQNDTAEILGVKVNLHSTSSGHYCVPVVAREISTEHTHDMSLTRPNNREQHDTLLKKTSPKVKERNSPTTTTNQKQDSSNCNYDRKHVMVTDQVWNGTEQMNNMYKVTDQITKTEFKLDLDSLTTGARLIRT